MRILRFVATATALLVAVSCSDAGGPLDPTSRTLSVPAPSSAAAASGAQRVQTSGTFDAIIDQESFAFTPRGRNCLVQVTGQLVFSGTIVGTATGQTNALEFAPCSEVQSALPGTFADVFRSVAVFDGTVGGVPAHADLLYMGRTAAGGHITGRFVFSNGVAGRLEVDSRVAVGGTYSGKLVVR